MDFDSHILNQAFSSVAPIIRKAEDITRRGFPLTPSTRMVIEPVGSALNPQGVKVRVIGRF